MASDSFTDKVVLVTGASSGIGRALASAFARQGAHVALVARNRPKLQSLHDELANCPGRRLVLPTDVRDPQQVQAAVAAVLDQFGHIDVLVNNAGIGQASAVVATPAADYREILETNFYGALHFLQCVSRQMIQQRSGLIIQISSLNGLFPVPLGSAYCASKFALEGLSQCARLELRPHHVHLLIVRPGLTDTDFFDQAKNFRAADPFPMRHLQRPDQVARAIVRAAARRRSHLVLSPEGKLLWLLHKLSPSLVGWLIARHMNPRPAAAVPAASRPKSPLIVLSPAQETAPAADHTDAPSPSAPLIPDPAPRPAAR